MRKNFHKMAYTLAAVALLAMIVNVYKDNANGAITCWMSAVAIWLAGSSWQLNEDNKEHLKELTNIVEGICKSEIEDLNHRRESNAYLHRRIDNLQDQALELKFGWHRTTDLLPKLHEQVLLYIDESLAEDNDKAKRFRVACLIEAEDGIKEFVGPGACYGINKDLWWRYVTRPKESKNING